MYNAVTDNITIRVYIKGTVVDLKGPRRAKVYFYLE